MPMFRLCSIIALVFSFITVVFGAGEVVLDIGHSSSSQGAQTPGAVRGTIITEYAFWCKYAPVVKREVERAGFRCIIINRGNPPGSEPLASYVRAGRVVHLMRPDRGAQRYPSRYHPDRVASGMVSADYAIWKRAACIVFLHHNNISSRWLRKPCQGLILCNKYNGLRLADCIKSSLESEVINHGMNNGGISCRIMIRHVDADRAAGWLNACDDSGIPAAVVEAAYLDNYQHALYLSTDAGAQAYARAVGHGIVRYMKQYRREPRHFRANENAPDEGSFGYAKESRRLRVPGAKRLIR